MEASILRRFEPFSRSAAFGSSALICAEGCGSQAIRAQMGVVSANLEIADWLSVNSGEMNQLNKIDASFAGFGLGNERLGTRQQRRNLSLGQA